MVRFEPIVCCPGESFMGAHPRIGAVIQNATKLSLVSFFSLLLSLGTIAYGETPAEKEYAIKAAFIYNFAKFVEWPSESMSKSETLNVCVLGENPFGLSLKNLEGKEVQSKKFIVRKAKTIENMGQCHIVFVGKSFRNNLSEILAILRGQNVLTVGDMQGFAQQGGMIGFFVKDEMIRFEINLEAAQQTGLKISSKLLKLATIVSSDNS
jgi:hypothetical protein